MRPSHRIVCKELVCGTKIVISLWGAHTVSLHNPPFLSVSCKLPPVNAKSFGAQSIEDVIVRVFWAVHQQVADKF